MPTRAKVVILPREKKPLYILETIFPDPGPFQVVVKQFASGICHTQLYAIQNDRTEPQLLGHESSSKGKEVTHVNKGDRVLLTWVPRNKPANPRLPVQPTLQLSDGSIASALMIYTWADHTVADEQYVVKVPNNVPMDVTSVIGCVVVTRAGAVLNTPGVKKGESVAIKLHFS
jgi:Zn-dependent alcohol dehydrogenase